MDASALLRARAPASMRCALPATLRSSMWLQRCVTTRQPYNNDTSSLLLSAGPMARAMAPSSCLHAGCHCVPHSRNLRRKPCRAVDYRCGGACPTLGAAPKPSRCMKGGGHYSNTSTYRHQGRAPCAFCAPQV